MICTSAPLMAPPVVSTTAPPMAPVAPPWAYARAPDSSAASNTVPIATLRRPRIFTPPDTKVALPTIRGAFPSVHQRPVRTVDFRTPRWILLTLPIFEASDSPPACQETTRIKFLLCENPCVNPCSRCASVCVGLDALDGKRDHELVKAVQPLHVFCRPIVVARPPRGGPCRSALCFLRFW